MGHGIGALVVHTVRVRAAVEEAVRWDLRPVPLGGALTMFHIDHYYTAYWGHVRPEPGGIDLPPRVPGVFPGDAVVRRIARELTGDAEPTFAILMTDYFGGAGGQWACAFTGTRRITGDDTRINAALRALGVVRTAELDEFDTVDLGAHRSSPDELEKYVGLCDEVGV